MTRCGLAGTASCEERAEGVETVRVADVCGGGTLGTVQEKEGFLAVASKWGDVEACFLWSAEVDIRRGMLWTILLRLLRLDRAEGKFGMTGHMSASRFLSISRDSSVPARDAQAGR